MSTAWTRFMDMHSGGGLKHGASHIYIEAPETEARVIFYNVFGTNPARVSCTCCGEDYAVDEAPSLAQASAFDRGCDFVYRRPDGSECPREEAWVFGKGNLEGYTAAYEERHGDSAWRPYMPLEKYLKSPDIRVLYAQDITSEQRVGEVPEQGYVWR